MSKSLPAVVWDEDPRKVASRARRLYPAQHASGIWGWTEKASEADGIVGTTTNVRWGVGLWTTGITGGSDVLGVDDSTTTGGARVLALNGTITVALETES